MICAPVRIITLNRHKHLARCLEALEQNKLAKDTVVYVSVDYPAKEAHKAGYEKVCEYLKEKENHNGFKELIVIFQEKNLGSGDNARFLEKVIFEKWDRIIRMADDVEASPNYLEYMNCMLELAERMPQLFGVCAYWGLKDKEINELVSGYPAVARMAFNPWGGFGVLKEQMDELNSLLAGGWLDEVAGSWSAMHRLYKYRKYTFYMFVTGYLINRDPVFFLNDGSIRNIDITMDMYIALMNKVVVFPTISKAANWGFDGSGEHCSKEKKDILTVDCSAEFICKEEDIVWLDDNMARKLSWKGVKHKKDVYMAVFAYLRYRMRKWVGKP